MPTTSVDLAPKLVTRREATVALTIIVTASGRNANPASIGL
jgi:hypothetical protein